MDIHRRTPLSERLFNELNTLGLFVLLAGFGGFLLGTVPRLTSAHPQRGAFPVAYVVQFVVTVLTVGLIYYAWRIYRPPQSQPASKPQTVGGFAKTTLQNYLIWPGVYTLTILYQLAVHGKSAAVQTASDTWWIPVIGGVIYLLSFVLGAGGKAITSQVQNRTQSR